LPSTILERGKPVQPRRHDLGERAARAPRSRIRTTVSAKAAQARTPTESSTRAPKIAQPSIGLLADLIRFGAEADIAIESRPHVGSNRLPKVLTALRTFLESRGVHYKFSSVIA
jgi:uncharacterized FAD-dependent dehydrogenase